jgi:hypothetical protein
MTRRKTADDLANDMLAQVDLSHAICNHRIDGLRETVTELRHQNRDLERERTTATFETWLAEHEHEVIIRSKFLARETQVEVLRMAFEAGRTS